MKQYAYRIYRNTPANPVVGGTVTSESMEEAIKAIIHRDNVQVIHISEHGLRYHHFEMNGSKVGILVYARPEDY